MKQKDFKVVYEQSKEKNIQSDIFFNCAGWFWLNLTETQLSKMTKLMVKQGAEITNGFIYLTNGLGIKA